MNKLFTQLLSGLLLVLCMNLQARAVEYELPDLDGNVQSLDQYKGKWVIVNYWATWCSTCMKEIPDLIDFHENNKDKGAIVIGINYESIDLLELQNHVDELSLPYPVLSSKPIPVTPLGRVPALPTTYIIDPEGNVVAGEVGIVSREDLETYINQENTQRNASEQSPDQDDVS